MRTVRFPLLLVSIFTVMGDRHSLKGFPDSSSKQATVSSSGILGNGAENQTNGTVKEKQSINRQKCFRFVQKKSTSWAIS